jgi:hypothetical protein
MGCRTAFIQEPGAYVPGPTTAAESSGTAGASSGATAGESSGASR